MMANVETTLNARLADLLDGMRYIWRAHAEQSGILRRSGQIDVLVSEDGWPRVIVECKIGLKPENADKRFDDVFRDNGAAPRIVFEVKYDERLRNPEARMKRAERLRYCVHYGKDSRFPRSGWLDGSILDLSVAIQYAREAVIPAGGTKELGEAVEKAAKLIGRTGARDEISNTMAQPVSEQTDAMAALTLAGALQFHDTAALSEPDADGESEADESSGNEAAGDESKDAEPSANGEPDAEPEIPLLGRITFDGSADISGLGRWQRLGNCSARPRRRITPRTADSAGSCNRRV